MISLTVVTHVVNYSKASIPKGEETIPRSRKQVERIFERWVGNAGARRPLFFFNGMCARILHGPRVSVFKSNRQRARGSANRDIRLVAPVFPLPKRFSINALPFGQNVCFIVRRLKNNGEERNIPEVFFFYLFLSSMK